MPPMRTTNLIVRPTGMGGVFDSIGTFLTNVGTAYGKATAPTPMIDPNTGTVINGATPPIYMPPADTGPSTGTIVMLGGIGIAAYLLLKKRKK